MKRTRWIFGAATVAGVAVLVAPAVGQGKADVGSSGHLHWARVPGLLRAGSLDPTFGSKGVVTDGPDGGINGIAVQPDGKIVVAGGSSLARYLPSGSPDPSFGNGGHVELTALGASRVALQPDGKIVVAGSASPDFVVARYNPDGSPDTSFGTDGVVATVIPGPPGYATYFCGSDGNSLCPPSSAVAALTVLPGGNVVAAGSTYGLEADDVGNYWLSSFVLVRYTSDGSLDPTWGDGGIVETGGGDVALGGMAVLPSGKIVATGAGYGLGKGDDGEWMLLARYLADGSLDPSFGTNGNGTTTTSDLGELAGGPFALQDGKIVVAGASPRPAYGTGLSPVLARFGATGRLDTSFGRQGFAQIRLGSVRPSAVVTQPNGKILLATANSVVRLLPNGQLDASFGIGGIVSLHHPVSSLALQGNGRIVVGVGTTLARLMGQPALLGSREGATITSYDFGALDGGGAPVTRGFKLATPGLAQSGKLAISLTGSPAFSITSDSCTGKSIGKKLSCWVSVTYKPLGAPTNESATLRATGADGVAASLSLSASNLGPSGYIYWVNNVPNGTVNKVPRGGGPVTVLASGQHYPTSVAVDSTHVYWTTYGGEINAVPLGGGTVTTLASGQHSPVSVAVDGTHVYWINTGTWGGSDGAVNEVPLGGGKVTTLASGQGTPVSLAVDGTQVYWVTYGIEGASDGTVNEAPVGGGTVTTLATGQNAPTAVAVHGTHVYWVDCWGGTVNKVAIGGGIVNTLATGQECPESVAVDGTHVYWTGYWWSNNEPVNEVPVGGGSVTTIGRTGTDEPSPVALDGTHVYWAAAQTAVQKAQLGGGPTITLARKQGYLWDLAVGP
jgi:uncharacterized delta-60 repeat protein